MNSPYKGKFRVSQQFKGAEHDGLDLVGVDSKDIYATVDGTVERADYENSADKKQGFGLYVRIRKTGSGDRYYYGHLSKVFVKVGQTVKKGDLIGTEGSTGKSTGSHCHYCARTDCLKSKFLNICDISGIPNRIGTFGAVSENPKTQTKSADEIAKEVINGKWGNGEDRKRRLAAADYDYKTVQAKVNELMKPKNTVKSTEQIAKEVIKGVWGNGEERKKKLTAAGYNYKTVQQAVNKLLR